MIRPAMLAISLACLSVDARCAGFQLMEQSARGLAMSLSQGAAGTGDPTALYYNPAGLADLDGAQFAGVLSGFQVRSQFADAGSQPAAGQALGETSADGGTSAVIPAFFGSYRASERWTVGAGIYAPFGLATRYCDCWVGRFQAVDSEIQSLALAGALAFHPDPRFSLGFGVELMQFRAELTNRVNYTAVINQASIAIGNGPLVIPGAAGHAKLEGDDTGVIYTAGLRIALDRNVHLGLSYRSGTKLHVRGQASFDAPPLPPPVSTLAALALPSGGASLRLETPDNVAAGLSARSGPWTFAAEAGRTGWSSIPEQRVIRDDGSLLQVTRLDWRDTWRFSVGTSYQWSPALTLRAGLTLDETPVPDATRNPRLPEGDRRSFSGGFTWVLGMSDSIDVAMAYTRMGAAPISQDDGNAALNGLVSGSYSSRSYLVAVQYNRRF